MSRRHFLRSFFTLALAVVALGLFTACPDSSSKEIVFGALLPQTGDSSLYYDAIKNGMDLAVEEINAAGGVRGGRQIRIEYRDTATDGATAQRAAVELIDLGVPAIIGAVRSTVTLEVAPVVNENERILLSPASSSPELSKRGGRWFFRVFPSDVAESVKMADFCTEHLISSVAVIASDAEFGQGLANIFTERYVAGPREVVLRENVPEDISPDQADEIARTIKRLRPQAIYVAGYLPETAEVIAAINRANVPNAWILGTSAITKDIIDLAGGNGNGVIFPQPSWDVNSDSPNIAPFVSAYRLKFSSDPDTYAAHSYDAVKVLADATDRADFPDAKETLRALRTTNILGASGRIKFTSDGDVIKAPRLFVVHEDSVITLDRYEEIATLDRLAN